MKAIFLKEELSELFGALISNDIGDICINSKDSKIGDLFIAMRGEKTDAHNFVEEAIAKGASLAIVEKFVNHIDQDRFIMVESSYDALLKLANYNLSKTDATYIGVTGSVGKTTTKNLIHHMLAAQVELHNQIYVSRKNFNSQIGLPICAATMPRATKIGIFEMGMSSGGDIKKLIEIVEPSISVITQICEAHLEFFSSMLDIAKAKSEIFETKKEQMAAIIPFDTPYYEFLMEQAKHNRVKNILSFGYGNADAKIISIKYTKDNIHAVCNILGEKISIEMPCENYSCILNCMPAILASHISSNICIRKLAETVCSFFGSSQRGQKTYIKNRDIVIIDDSYNACPTSMRAAILSMSHYENRRKILVMGDMLELGKDQIFYHETLSPCMDKASVDMVFACGDLSSHLFNNLRHDIKGVWKQSASELLEDVLDNVKDGDCVLIKGSRSMKMDIIAEAIKNRG